MITDLYIPVLTPSLNKTKGEHWSKKTTRRNAFQYWIRSLTRYRHTGTVRVEMTRIAKRFLDKDNYIGGAKDLVDSLVLEKVIVDDRESIVVEREWNQVKPAKGQKEGMYIKITDLNE